MNIRSLTRGDGVVIGAAVLLLIASFLPFFSADGCSGDECDVNAWSSATLPMLPTVHLAALIAAGLFVAARALPAERKVLTLTLAQWGLAVSVFVGWAALWSAFSNLFPDLGGGLGGDPNDSIDMGAGGYLTIIFGLALAAGGVLGTTLPALKAPLAGGAAPAAAPYGGGAAAPQAGYGYPGPGSQAAAPSPYGQQQPFGQPGGQPAPAAGAGAPQPAPAAAGGSADFAPFWFAVPVARPLYAEDGSSTTIAELAPGTWYLAVEQRGQALVAQTQDGRRGVLQDTSGIQRG
ncbi:hypothetical protein [Streptomyces sp. NPDC018031]|uniref:hypothetical protein n=1 Tax=Streptomyces sp. NPDC018031 TaxID=3365033 RepID=UPI0037928DBC